MLSGRSHSLLVDSRISRLPFVGCLVVTIAREACSELNHVQKCQSTNQIADIPLHWSSKLLVLASFFRFLHSFHCYCGLLLLCNDNNSSLLGCDGALSE